MSHKQLIAHTDATGKQAAFTVLFAAPESTGGECVIAVLFTGDGEKIDLGERCAPTAITWRSTREQALASHTYQTGGPQHAELHWGSEVLKTSAATTPPSAPPAVVLTLFEIKRVAKQPYKIEIRTAVSGLKNGQRLRIDSGAGGIFWQSRNAKQSFVAEYGKAGPYLVAIDLVDADGFWLTTLGEQSVAIADPQGQALAPVEPTLKAEVATAPPAEAQSAELTAAAVPWLPFRYCRPQVGARTYKTPGGAVSRTLGAGTYLAIRQEVMSGGKLWYQTGGYDWISAAAVTLVIPSELRGVGLGGTPPPPPPPPGDRQGVVTASVLNVRSGPGVTNPIVGTLRAGDVVTIFGEAVAAGAIWYRIGENRWVHSGYIRLLPQAAAAVTQVTQDVAAAMALPVGFTVASSLNVRSRPEANAPIVGQLAHNQSMTILGSQTTAGQLWYRIAAEQWVSGEWVGVARAKARPASIRPNERWMGVSLKEQTAIAYEGDKPVYAALIASGQAGTPTVQGVFRTWWRLISRGMSGPGYFLEEVTWTCYFYGGYALHTAYWHDAFGRPRSHGCVNFSPYDAWWIFQWSAPGGANSPAVYTYWA